MIKRLQHLKELKRLLSHNPVVALLGARQVGKTTLTRKLARLRKSPTHFFDLESAAELERHPKVGASWEGFIIETLIQALGVEDRQCYFWATHSGPEIDLVVHQGGRLRGFEIKRITAPTFTRSMRSALRDLRLTRVDIIHAGTESFALDKQVHAIVAKRLLQDIS